MGHAGLICELVALSRLSKWPCRFLSSELSCQLFALDARQSGHAVALRPLFGEVDRFHIIVTNCDNQTATLEIL
ncbi:hypothetical protein Taro_055803 [Colocasia esculenta]|uniref:Uncharacterized protein n=1 Tax=Colocasia esculenta TaxID=4460 RepID=A0A843XVE2_COLES|nr:hypothetical protein [Colocasia esculenta]